MSTIRVAERPRFTTVDRRAINDTRLSMRARGVLVWLLDKPDNWRADAEAIARETTEGRDAIRTALNELKDAGYLVVTKGRDEAGRWATEQVLHELPQDGSMSELSEPSGADNQRRSTSAGEPGPIEKTENEDCERTPTSSQSDSRAEPPSWSEERNRPQRVPSMIAEWTKVQTLASQGNKSWRNHPDLHPLTRLCASRIATVLVFGTVTDARVAFIEAWKQETASRRDAA